MGNFYLNHCPLMILLREKVKLIYAETTRENDDVWRVTCNVLLAFTFPSPDRSLQLVRVPDDDRTTARPRQLGQSPGPPPGHLPPPLQPLREGSIYFYTLFSWTGPFSGSAGSIVHLAYGGNNGRFYQGQGAMGVWESNGPLNAVLGVQFSPLSYRWEFEN